MTAAPPDVRLTVRVRGRVQGVGFRWWTRARALELGLVGSATNRPDGSVEVVAQGPADACRTLLALLQPDAPGDRPGAVDAVGVWWGEPHQTSPGVAGFAER